MTKVKNMITDFTEGSVVKQLLVFATPLFLSNLLQVVYNMVDMIVVGKVMGQVGLSAVSVGGDVQGLLTFVAMGFANAGQVIISQLLGAGQREKLGRFIGTMTSFLGIMAIVLSLAALLLRNSILSWMNTPEAAWNEAMAYSVTCAVGLLFIYGYNVVSSILRGMGDSKHPFIFISIAAVMNIVLDIVFVKFCNMGAFGAAFATVISQSFSFICALVFLIRNRNKLGFEISSRSFLIDRELLGTLLKLGIPMAIKQTSVYFSKVFVNSYINAYGVTVSAVAGIANKMQSIINTISNSLNTAGASMVGQNVGAEKYHRVPKILITVFSINIVVALLFCAAMFFFPAQIFLLFTDDTGILPVAMEFVPIAYIVFITSALRSCTNSLINGSGNYKVNFAVAIIDGIVARIGLSLLFGIALKMKYVGFWYGDAFAGFSPFIIGGIYFLSGTWKTRKYIIKE